MHYQIVFVIVLFILLIIEQRLMYADPVKYHVAYWVLGALLAHNISSYSAKNFVRLNDYLASKAQ